MSRRHARLLVTDILEVIDLGSSNGIQVQGQQVDRAVLKSGDRFKIGETESRCGSPEATPVCAAARGTSLPFSRSPRIAPLYVGREFPLPALPERPSRSGRRGSPLRCRCSWVWRSPWRSENPMFLLFILLTPAMLFGHYLESRRTARKDYEQALVEFREDLGIMVDQLKEEQEREVVGRQAEHPASSESVDAVGSASTLLWTRRPGDPGFCEFRLGMAPCPRATP